MQHSVSKSKMGADSQEISLDVLRDEVINEEHPLYGPKIRKVGIICGCRICLFGHMSIEAIMNEFSLEEVLDRLEGEDSE